MQIIHDISLSNYTTFRVGGICRNLFVPETEEELIDLANNVNDCRFIGGGSNLLINDEAIFNNIVILKRFSGSINNQSNGIFEVSAAVSLIKLVEYVNTQGYGGIEYLCSIPGLVGGAIYMNAGRGRSAKKSISDSILSVRVLCINEDGVMHKRGDIVELTKDECNFGYRTSLFKNNNYLILSAKLQLLPVKKEDGDKYIQEHREWCTKSQDRLFPNFGSVFCEHSRKLMYVIMKLGMGNAKGVHFSRKAFNWLLNSKSNNLEPGAFKEAISLIERVEKMHKFFGKKCEREVVVWYK